MMPHYTQPTNAAQSPHSLTDSLKQIHLFSTPLHIGFTLAGALVFAGAATGLAVTNSVQRPEPTPKQTTLQNAQSQGTPPPQQPIPQDNSSQGSSVNASLSGTNNDVHLNVNGKDIPVPPNGSTEQTITSSDGTSHTTVNASSSSEVNGAASNSSSTSFNLQITSNSESTGGSSSP